MADAQIPPSETSSRGTRATRCLLTRWVSRASVTHRWPRGRVATASAPRPQPQRAAAAGRDQGRVRIEPSKPRNRTAGLPRATAGVGVGVADQRVRRSPERSRLLAARTVARLSRQAAPCVRLGSARGPLRLAWTTSRCPAPAASTPIVMAAQSGAPTSSAGMIMSATSVKPILDIGRRSFAGRGSPGLAGLRAAHDHQAPSASRAVQRRRVVVLRPCQSRITASATTAMRATSDEK
jgi:hypothetical protein